MDEINAEVAIWPCIMSSIGYVRTMGEGTSILAVAMLLVFAIGLTCVDMLVLVMAAWNLPSAGSDTQPAARGDAAALSKPRYKNQAMRAAKVLGKLSMLDVAVMGVVVVCFSAGMYKQMG